MGLFWGEGQEKKVGGAGREKARAEVGQETGWKRKLNGPNIIFSEYRWVRIDLHRSSNTMEQSISTCWKLVDNVLGVSIERVLGSRCH
ncbi:hypothetical protein Bpfe_001456 [Biomphalaria pfeifferi]|uniref:Uncharacterized protein n=1 Tax=Biomphalaria pfeifferi TaxID=112525 RepID=A0AAD8FND7_BIOPF|nr:hypothetical protein Bpfe_001456 [Biomphalaria pfeifferi]